MALLKLATGPSIKILYIDIYLWISYILCGLYVGTADFVQFPLETIGALCIFACSILVLSHKRRLKL